VEWRRTHQRTVQSMPQFSLSPKRGWLPPRHARRTSNTLGMMWLMAVSVAGAEEVGVPGDIKYIKCEVCESLVGALHSHVATARLKDRHSMKSESDVQEVVEQACKAETPVGEWLRSIDLVEDDAAGRLKLERQKTDGPCGKECRTVALACEALLEEGWENELGEGLYTGEGVAELRASACKEWSSACRRAPPKLASSRSPGPKFRAYTDEERALNEERRGAPPPPGLLSEEELRFRLAVDEEGAPSALDGRLGASEAAGRFGTNDPDPAGPAPIDLTKTAAFVEAAWY